MVVKWSTEKMKKSRRQSKRMIAGRLKLKHEQISVVLPPIQLQSFQRSCNVDNFGPRFLVNPFPQQMGYIQATYKCSWT
jgi:hypothetical protein